MESSSANSVITNRCIDWSTLPEPVNSRFCEVTRNRKITAIALIAIALAATTCALIAATSFVVAPVVILGLAAVATACTLTAIVLLCLKPSFNDPVHRMALRQEVKDYVDSDNAKLKYAQIRERYNAQLIGNDEINVLIADDAAKYSYEAFLKKHGENVVFILDQENIDVLRPKFLSHCIEKLSLNEIAANPFIKISGLQAGDYIEAVASREAEAALNGIESIVIHEDEAKSIVVKKDAYTTFFARNPLNACVYLKGNELLSAAMSEVVESYLVEKYKNLGINEFKNNVHYKEQACVIGQDFALKIENQILSQQMTALMKGDINYAVFRSQNGVESIQFLINASEENLAFFQNKYLELNLKTQKQLLEDQKFLQTTLELKLQVLEKKWKGLSFAEIVKHPDFISSLDEDCPPREWTDIALHATHHMSILEIAKHMPILFDRGILQWADSLPGYVWGNILERLEAEIRCIKRFENLAAYPNVLFDKNLIQKSNPTVQELIEGFIQRNLGLFFPNPNVTLELSSQAAFCKIRCLKLVAEPLLTRLKEAISIYSKEIDLYSSQCSRETEKVHQHIAHLESEKSAAIAKANKNSGIDSARAKVSAYKNSLGEFRSELQLLQREKQNTGVNYQKEIENITQRLRQAERELGAAELSFQESSCKLSQAVTEIEAKYDELITAYKYTKETTEQKNATAFNDKLNQIARDYLKFL